MVSRRRDVVREPGALVRREAGAAEPAAPTQRRVVLHNAARRAVPRGHLSVEVEVADRAPEPPGYTAGPRIRLIRGSRSRRRQRGFR